MLGAGDCLDIMAPDSIGKALREIDNGPTPK